MGADEDSIFDGDDMIDGDIVLDFDAITDDHAHIDVDIFPNVTLCPNLRAASHLHQVPNMRSRADASITGNLSRWMNKYPFHHSPPNFIRLQLTQRFSLKHITYRQYSGLFNLRFSIAYCFASSSYDSGRPDLR